MKVFEAHSDAEIERRLALSFQTFRCYRKTPFFERAAKLVRVAEIMEADKRKFAAMMTAEMGKTIGSAEAEAAKCAWACRYYAETAEQSLADAPIPTDGARTFVRYQAAGAGTGRHAVELSFSGRFSASPLPLWMAGNTGLLKHSSNVPQCALAIEEVFARAGFPEGAFQTLLVGSDKVAALIGDDRIQAVTLTGSEPAGRAVASQAGRQIKKTVLELGGSDPFIIMPSARLDEALPAAVKARVINNGQSCIAAKRFIVADSVYDTCEGANSSHG